jgi:site-specific DNA-methyltransferase (adenine-specific)
MRYLVRLVTPKGGVCLDPFLGSGTTAVACKSEKFDYIGIELSQEYADIAEARIKAEVVQYDIFDILEG